MDPIDNFVPKNASCSTHDEISEVTLPDSKQQPMSCGQYLKFKKDKVKLLEKKNDLHILSAPPEICDI